MSRPLCKKCGKVQAVRTGGLCNGCFNESISNGAKPVQSVMVPVSKIVMTADTQTRAATRHDVVDEYASPKVVGKLPPVILFTEDEETYWPADGFHRIPAWIKAGWTEIPADVRKGDKREAIRVGVGCNDTHGLRRTSEDKRQAIKMLLADEEWSGASNRWIADQCNVSDGLVESVRSESTSRNGSSTARIGGPAELAGGSSTANSGGSNEEAPKRRGRDGKMRAATTPKTLCERCQRVAPGKGLPDCAACTEVRKAADKKKKAAAAKKRQAAASAPRPDVKDQTGAVVPDSCRDAFADTSLPDLIAELESVEVMLTAKSWVTRAGELTAHYPFILIEKVTEHAYEALHQLQVALNAIKAGLPYAVCPKCQGVDSKKDGKTCRTCRGGGHVAEARWNELQAGK